MNILLIGNGFDLAHGLPTSYMDFLEFTRVIKEVLDIFNSKDNGQIEWGKLHPEIKKQIQKNMGNIRDNIFSEEEMWNNLIKNNFWIDYFSQSGKHHGLENWINFEDEISKVIKSITGIIQRIDNNFSLYNRVTEWPNDSFTKVHFSSKEITYKILRDSLLSDLNKLIKALDIYLTDYVERIYVDVISPDIRELEIGYVLSFNYTHTFLKKYQISEKGIQTQEKSFDYIHGETGKDENNMVLGIDEYLPENRKNKDIEFIAFKKYYQRIHKGTGCKYKKWLDEIIQENSKYNRGIQQCESFIEEYDEDGDDRLETEATLERLKTKRPKHNLYIFGHSLDVTDKDILKELILTENMFTTVFYRNPDQKGQQIANLVKVIGQDELIKRTGGGSARTIEFKQQQNMIKKPAENIRSADQVSKTSN